MSYDIGTLDRARGRWLEILPRFGISPSFLVNKHGPCPCCGGRDRFRFDNKDGSGSFYCGQCGPGGSGILLIQRIKDWNFKTACDEVDKIIGTAEPVKWPEPVKDDAERKRRAVQRALDEAAEVGAADRYLGKRGLSVSSSILRGQERCPYFSDDRKMVGRFPALVAPIIGPDGSLQGVHRIYDADVSPRKKTMPPVTTIKGGAVRLFDCDEELAIAEGIETSLAVHEMFGGPVWACLTAGGIESFEPPRGLLRLAIYADCDESFTGQLAAYSLAHRLWKEAGTGKRDPIAVTVYVPPVPGKDWLDVLNEQKGVAA